MAITRSTASRVRKGRVGDSVYYTSQGREIVRAALNSSNYGASASRTEAQQSRRVRWSNLVNFYKASKGWMHKAFENRKAGVSDYNMLIKLNVNGSTIALTKQQAASGACVAEPFQVSQGSLMPIESVKRSNIWRTNIALGSLSITATTTVGEFSQAVIAANSWLRENMQISFVSYQQTIDNSNVPRVICTSYEVTLSDSSTELLRSYLPEFCSSADNGFLATSSAISPGCFTYVLSESDGGRTMVSSQTLVNNNADTIARYSSSQQVSDAIASYGVSGSVFLDSGSQPVDPTAQPKALIGLTAGGVAFTMAGPSVTAADIRGKQMRLTFSMAVQNVGDIELEFIGQDSTKYTISLDTTSAPTISNNVVTYSNVVLDSNIPNTAMLYNAYIEADGADYLLGYENAPDWGKALGE